LSEKDPQAAGLASEMLKKRAHGIMDVNNSVMLVIE